MAQVVLENVVKRYPNGFAAVKCVNQCIADREFVVLVGPSGCGKTTTLRMVAGLEEITSGTIKIGERVVNDIAPKDRDIAMVFQNYALYPHMTVYKNLAFALQLRRVPRKEIEERVRWAAKTLGLEELLDRRPKQLSGGQRQRVAVGRAIVRKPQVFLFDEPLSNLDAKLRVSTRAELKKLQLDLQTTTLYVTHDQEEAMTLGDRVVVMNRGIVHQCGTPLEVYRSPVDRFVAGFVGMPPMNFVNGILKKDEQGIWFTGQGIHIQIPPTRLGRVEEFLEQEVSLGIRPETTHIVDRQQPGATVVSVDVVEILGATMDLYVRTTMKQRLVCRVPTDLVQVGDTIGIAIDSNSIHVFELDQPGTDDDQPARYGDNLTLAKAAVA